MLIQYVRKIWQGEMVMKSIDEIHVEVISDPEIIASANYERSLFELDREIYQLSGHADQLDYFVAVASGIVCGMVDVLWTGDFDFQAGRAITADKVNGFVIKTAKMLGCPGDDIKGSVAFLENKFPVPSDGNTPDFGGGLQHHLRDFGHHPTIVGLFFSLLTQFTGMSYGTDTSGSFISVPVPEKSLEYIGADVPEKIFRGTVTWFFHLVSDVAGSSSTAGLSGGTGIPGPILSLAKELAALPVFKNTSTGNNDLSIFLSKVFNGTLFAKRDENGNIIRDTVEKFDFRGELGAAFESGKQAGPVVANDIIVRSFYFVRRLASEIKNTHVSSFSDLQRLDWEQCKPFDNRTIDRMLLIASGVFSSIDLTGAVLTKKYWVSVNYIGLGRFTVAVGTEAVNLLRLRDIQKVKRMYERIQQNTFGNTDNRIYGRLGDQEDNEKADSRFGLTLEQTEILYNLECYKTRNDIRKTGGLLGKDQMMQLKIKWLAEWENYIETGFPGFTNDPHAVLHWYDESTLLKKIAENDPSQVWFRLVLLEVMVFEPYYPLSVVNGSKGATPSTKYKALDNPVYGFNKGEGDRFLEAFFKSQPYYKAGYVKRLRTCYDKVIKELTEVLKTALTSLGIAAVMTIAFATVIGAFAGPIAVAMVGSNFTGLSGAALTSACLAYVGGGAIAAGGAGMLGGTIAIVGGGTLLGMGVGAGVGGVVGAASLMGKKGTILQSAKLLVSVREIFLNDEHDTEYSDYVYEQYVKKITEIEKGLVDLKMKAETTSKEEQEKLRKEIKNAEEAVHVMKIAMKSLNRYKSSFEFGYDHR